LSRQAGAYCENLLAHDRRIDGAAILTRLGRRRMPYLSVRRLGLVSLIEDYGKRQVAFLLAEGQRRWQQPDVRWGFEMSMWARRRAARLGTGTARPAGSNWTLTCGSNLTDSEWMQLQNCLPVAPFPPAAEHGLVNAVLYVLCTGCSWDELPDVGVDPDTAFQFCRYWRHHGMWEALACSLENPREPFLTWTRLATQRREDTID
jgi:transposase